MTILATNAPSPYVDAMSSDDADGGGGGDGGHVCDFTDKYIIGVDKTPCLTKGLEWRAMPTYNVMFGNVLLSG